MSIKKWLGYLLFVIASYLVFLIGTLPATQLYHIAKKQLPALQLDQISGSIWDGRAQQITVNQLKTGPIFWQFKPLSLFLGKIEVDFTNTDSQLSATGSAAINLSGKLLLSNLTGESSTKTITSLIPNMPVTPVGRIIFNLSEISFREQYLSSVTGSIDWQRAGLTEPLNIQIGKLNLILTTDNEVIHGAISGKGATIGINAQLELQQNGQYQIKGKIQPKPNTPADLSNALKMLGRPDPAGAITIDLSGNL